MVRMPGQRYRKIEAGERTSEVNRFVRRFLINAAASKATRREQLISLRCRISAWDHGINECQKNARENDELNYGLVTII